MNLEAFYKNSLNFLESNLSGKLWLWKLVIVAVVISIVLAFPPYSLLIEHLKPDGVKLDAWLFIHNQSVDLLHPSEYTLGVRREAMVFRWVLPALYTLTGGNILLIVLLQAILAVLFLYLVARFSFQLLNDKAQTALIVLAISNIFVGTWGFADIHGYGDGIAYFLLLLALVSVNPWVIFLAIFTACFTDERAIVASSFVVIFWVIQNSFENKTFDFRSTFQSLFLGKSKYIWLAWMGCFGIRLYVKFNYFQHHVYSAVGLPVMFENRHRAGIGSSIWSNYEGTWLLLVAAMITLLLLKRYWLLLLFMGGFGIVLTSGFFVHDIDRAYGYGFPFILAALLILQNTATPKTISLLLFFTAIICVLQPQVFTMGYNQIIWEEPLPVKMFIYLDRLMGWQLGS